MTKVHRKATVKKGLSFLLALLLTFPIFSSFASAAEITPYYNNVATVRSNAIITSSGYMEVTNQYFGIPDQIDHVVIETKIEKKTLGIFWFDVDGGEWTDTLYQEFYTGSHGVQLSEKGTYRVTVDYTFYGTSGKNDEVRSQFTKEY